MTEKTTKELRDIIKFEKTIDSQLPIMINNCRLDEYIPTCGKCSKQISAEFVKGSVVKITDSVYKISATHACFDCLLIGQSEGRIRGIKNGYQLERIVNGEWIAYQFVAQNPSIFNLVKWLRIFKNKLFPSLKK